MDGKETRHLDTQQPEAILVAGSWAPAGTGAVTAVRGKGFTVARTDVGKYRVTFTGRYAQLVASGAGVALATPDDRIPIVNGETIGTTATNTLDVNIVDGSGSAAEIAANANNRVSFWALLSNTSFPNA